MAETPNLLSTLQSYFGYDSFLPFQEEIIDNVLDGRDTLVVMPTGAGKSLCYQLPALIFEGITLVVSPLVALMKDQVDSLKLNGISAEFINSSLSAREIDQVQERARRSQIRILYVAPERLAMPAFNRFLLGLDLQLIAIDEAHCISEWGHEFRPEYRNLRRLREDFPEVPIVALTATATEQVREDIVSQLNLHKGRVFLSSFNRPNLRYSVRSKVHADKEIMSLLLNKRGQSAIIYCFSRQETEELAKRLQANDLSALPYHAGMATEIRQRNQDDFIHDRVNIMVATIAFGMGVDKPDVRLAVHYSLPKSLEGYYQETGRAGRDGLPSDCILFYSHADKVKQDYFINQVEDAHERRNAQQKLATMAEYAWLPACRRNFILEYFGESSASGNCGACDVCMEPREQFDATEIAQKILSAVVRTGERFGADHVTQILIGNKGKRILEQGHDRLSVYGIAKGEDRAQLRDIIGQLQAKDLLTRSQSEFPTLSLTPRGREFLNQRQRLTLTKPRSTGQGRAPRSEKSSRLTEYDRGLFEELRTLRQRMADAQNVPLFVVFGDASLRQMAAEFPLNIEEFSKIHGVGQAKLERYGPEFLEVIRKFLESSGLPVATAAVLMRQRSNKKQMHEDRGSARGPGRRTEEETRKLLSQGLTISQAAQTRNLTETTIIGHLERMSGQHVELNLQHVLPDTDTLEAIRRAFGVCGSAQLKPVWEFLGATVTYNDLRLARIYFGQTALERDN